MVDKWLNLYDVDLKSNIGQLLYTVNLKKIENLKIRTGFFSQVLKFEYNGEAYSFTDFVGVKPALKVIEEAPGSIPGPTAGIHTQKPTIIF